MVGKVRSVLLTGACVVNLVAGCGDGRASRPGAATAPTTPASVRLSELTNPLVVPGDTSFLAAGLTGEGQLGTAVLEVTSDEVRASSVFESQTESGYSRFHGARAVGGGWAVVATRCDERASDDCVPNHDVIEISPDGDQRVLASVPAKGMAAIAGATQDHIVVQVGSNTPLADGPLQLSPAPMVEYAEELFVVDRERGTLRSSEWSPPVMRYNALVDPSALVPERFTCVDAGRLVVLDFDPTQTAPTRLMRVDLGSLSEGPAVELRTESDRVPAGVMCAGDETSVVLVSKQRQQVEIVSVGARGELDSIAATQWKTGLGRLTVNDATVLLIDRSDPSNEALNEGFGSGEASGSIQADASAVLYSNARWRSLSGGPVLGRLFASLDGGSVLGTDGTNFWRVEPS